MTDPSQVTFTHEARDQKRSVLVQSLDPIEIDSAACDAPGIQAALRWIDARTVIVELVSGPGLMQGDVPQSVACELRSKGKTIASIPINVVSVP